MTSATTFRSIFAGMMIFVGVFWAWTVGLMVAWPWDKSGQWLPDLHVVAVCADKQPCSIAYSELANAKAAGKYISLIPPEASGEAVDTQAWIRWTSPEGQPWQIEAKRSSWHFESTIRYKLEGANRDIPVLIQSRVVTGETMLYAFPLAIFTMAGLFFRRFRRKEKQ